MKIVVVVASSVAALGTFGAGVKYVTELKERVTFVEDELQEARDAVTTDLERIQGELDEANLEGIQGELDEAKQGLVAVVQELDDLEGETDGLRAALGDLADEANFTEYDWNHGNTSARRMLPVNEGICYLTRFTGAFEGTGEVVNIRKDEEQEYWYLDPVSGTNVSASARCWRFPWVEMSGDMEN